MPEARLLKFFAPVQARGRLYGHLRSDLQTHSKPFSNLAHHIAATVPKGPERTVALRNPRVTRATVQRC
jgi:hypothetical protein